jgi:hypothetical protein
MAKKNELNSFTAYYNKESIRQDHIRPFITVIAFYILYSGFVNMIFIYIRNILHKVVGFDHPVVVENKGVLEFWSDGFKKKVLKTLSIGSITRRVFQSNLSYFQPY